MPWGLFILLGVGLVLGWAMLVAYTAWLLTHPSRRGYAFAVARGLPGDPSELVLPGAPAGLVYKEWSVRARGRDLPVWDVRGLDPAGPTIIITHGWGDSRVVMLSRLAGLAPMASRVVLWDQPGHGDGPRGGFTLGAREHEDLMALIEAVSGRGAGARSPLILYGASLGAGASIVAAGMLMRRGGAESAGVIAEAPYRVPTVPARNVLRVRGMPYRSNLAPAMGLLGLRFGYGLSWALSPTAGGFDRAEHARRLPPGVPLLVLHGSEDPVCPPEDGRAIGGAAPSGRVVMVDGAGHNNLWTEPMFASRCAAAVREFLDVISVRTGGAVHGPAARAESV